MFSTLSETYIDDLIKLIENLFENNKNPNIKNL